MSLNLYESLVDSYKKAHPAVPVDDAEIEAEDIWQSLKTEYQGIGEGFERAVEDVIANQLEIVERRKASVMNYFAETPDSSSSSPGPAKKSSKSKSNPNKPKKKLKTDDENNTVTKEKEFKSEFAGTSNQRAFAQETLEIRISMYEHQLNSLYEAQNIKYSSSVDTEINSIKQKLKIDKQKLKRKQKNAEHQKKFREKKKAKLEELCNENPELKRKLAMRDSVGRPSLQQDQPELLAALAEIAREGSEQNLSDLSECIKSGRTLSELTAELRNRGFSISRSATYLRLLPKNSVSTEGLRHVETVPVKLSRALPDAKVHIDYEFATISIKYLESLASVLGPQQVLFLSQDDKSRVPFRATAESKLAPLLMHLEYRTKLPDYDWFVAERNKLIPSVYAGIIIDSTKIGNPEAVGYTGPTFIAIRSGKNGCSTANTHAQDFETLLELKEFKSIARTAEGYVKPVVIITVDGGPDESPRYEKVISFAVKHFKDYNLDGLFIATNAPGKNFNNRVERRLAPLRHELAGLILPHDLLGSPENQTVDVELEKNNFEAAAKILGEVWTTMTIEEHPVIASFIPPWESDVPDLPDPKWCSAHVRDSQYLLQITKCSDLTCCQPVRSGLFRILSERFLPPPLKILPTENDLIISEQGRFCELSLRLALKLENKTGFHIIPYDYACPSVKPVLAQRLCPKCGLYHASQKSAKRHAQMHKDCPVPKIKKLVPVRVAAYRANEVMCIIADKDGSNEDVEWWDEEDVCSSALKKLMPKTAIVPGLKVADVEEWIQGTWPADLPV